MQSTKSLPFRTLIQIRTLNKTRTLNQIRSLNQKGQSLVEYLIIVCLVAVGTIGIMRTFSEAVQHKFALMSKALGASYDGKLEAPKILESSVSKKDLRNFMQGAVSPSKGTQNSEAD